VTRDRERVESQALNALVRAAGRSGLPGVDGSSANGGARQGVRQGYRVAESNRSPAAARRAAAACRSRLGTRRLKRCWGRTSRRCAVDGLDSVTDLLASFDGGHLAVVSVGEAPAVPRASTSLQAKVKGATVLGSIAVVGAYRRNLARGSGLRIRLGAGESVVTRDGICWDRIGCACRAMRPARGRIEREETWRGIRAQVSGLADEVKELERPLELTRELGREREDRARPASGGT